MERLPPDTALAPATVAFAEGPPHEVALTDRALAAMLTPTSLAFEPFRILRTKVKSIFAESPKRCIGLISATAGEGVTTSTLGLALALAQEPDRRILVLEAGLRRPALATLLGLPTEPGLGEWLAEAQPPPVPIRRLEPWNVFLLAAGGAAVQSAELLGSERMAGVLEAARQAFDVVVVDCPPLTPWADSVALQEHLDGLLLVLRARYSDRSVIQSAVAHIKPGLVRGVVFNDHHDVFGHFRRRRRPRRR